MKNVSLYQQVASTLREDILRGKWEPGGLMPTEAALCAEFSVSRLTVRHAVAILEEEQLVVRRRGSGTYVSPHPTRRIPLEVDYTGSMRNHAPSIRRKLLQRDARRKADEILAQTLRLPEENPSLLWFQRADSLGKNVVAVDTGYIPERFADQLQPADLKRVDFLEVWSQKQNFTIHFCRQSIEAAPCPEDWAGVLELPAGAPVLMATEIYETESDVIGKFVSLYHPAHICLSSTYYWSRAQRRGA
ncbi:MAG: GntR family transcriptional regulator [Kiritimatiellia bacterium]